MKIGVLLRSDRPTMTFIRKGSSPLAGSVAHRRKSGTFTKTVGSSASFGSQRMRSMASSIWRTRSTAGTLSAPRVPFPMTPSWSSP